ncbi:hypothetical protein WISP_116381 [Willisornis vidua]|uniref:Uncharacterized protein n=1 Tax=Willisornis vidua TaxID=1566151 RepID=A0ABQ9CU00_9PASS|nr:hypothetical protein WISP_116381 [Willisornis vidua]
MTPTRSHSHSLCPTNPGCPLNILPKSDAPLNLQETAALGSFVHFVTFHIQTPPSSTTQWVNHFPGPAGHTLADSGQDAISLLGHQGTLLAHVELAVNQRTQIYHSQNLFRCVAFQPLCPKPVAVALSCYDPSAGTGTWPC